MQTIKQWATIAVTGLILSSGCKKEGPVGPQGPAGTNGNANVKSTIFTVIPYASGINYYADMNDFNITQNILDYGAVFVYEETWPNEWVALPYVMYPNSTYSVAVNVVSSLNYATVVWEASDQIIPNNPGATTFKVVVVTGSVIHDNPNLDWNNYSEVNQKFNLSN